MKPRLAVDKTRILGQCENAMRSLERAMPKATDRRLHAIARRGQHIQQARRASKRPSRMVHVDQLVDQKQLDAWELAQFRTSIPWLPKCVAARMLLEHEQANLRATYFLSTAFA